MKYQIVGREEYEPKWARQPYALGHSSAEIQRLKNQGDMLRPITERLLRSAGIDVGVRVLDLGCGAGEVSMLVAELVGPAGFVVGIDRSQEVLNVARKRTQEADCRRPVLYAPRLKSFPSMNLSIS
jgi:SAM-dependent methyltransferase